MKNFKILRALNSEIKYTKTISLALLTLSLKILLIFTKKVFVLVVFFIMEYTSISRNNTTFI